MIGAVGRARGSSSWTARSALAESAPAALSLVVYVGSGLAQSRAETAAIRAEYAERGHGARRGTAHWASLVLWCGGARGCWCLASNWLVGAAVAFARAFGVSELVIGLTIVAAGTSMPEVATSVMAAIRGERDIAVGNVIGSSTFNILGCLGVSGVVSANGLGIAPAVLNFDIWVMIAVAFACLPVLLLRRQIGRKRGLLFLAYYAAYLVYLILGAQQHDALDKFSAVMVSFVLPITVVTLVAMVVRQQASNSGPDG